MNAPGERRLRVGHGLFDPLSGDLSLDGRTVRLRPRTAAFLSHLVQHCDRPVSKDELMEIVWPGVIVTESSIVQCVKEIRQALGNAGRDWIRTLPKQGYVFVGNPPEDAASPLVLGSAINASNSFWKLLRARWPQIAASLAVTVVVLGGFAAREWTSPRPAAPADRPMSVIVLPFANVTGDARQDGTADEMTEALTDGLARTAGVAVVSPTTALAFKGKPVDPRTAGTTLGVRYVLEGSLRRGETGPLLNVRLSEAGTALQLWNEEYQAAGMDELRTLLKTRVAGTFGFQLTRAEARRAKTRQPPSPQAVELFNQARTIYDSSPKSRTDLARARDLLEQAVRLDEELIGAWRLLAIAMLENVRFSATREADLRRAEEAMRQAVARAPDVSGVRLAEGMVYSEQGRVRDALIAYRRAKELDPKNFPAYAWEADALTMLGRPQEAFAPLEQALQINPKHPWSRYIPLFIGIAHVQLGHDAQALEPLSRAAEASPQHPWPHLYLAAALGNLGREQEARRELDTLRQLLPAFTTISDFRAKELSREPEFVQQRIHFYEGLRRAGVPE